MKYIVLFKPVGFANFIRYTETANENYAKGVVKTLEENDVESYYIEEN